jgi:AFG3 family protein
VAHTLPAHWLLLHPCLPTHPPPTRAGWEGFRPKQGLKPGGVGRQGGQDTSGSSSSTSLQQGLLTLGAASLALATLSLASGSGGDGVKELSWQEFQRGLLAKGLVARIEVSNKALAKVYVRPTPAPGFAGTSDARGGAGDGSDTGAPWGAHTREAPQLPSWSGGAAARQGGAAAPSAAAGGMAASSAPGISGPAVSAGTMGAGAGGVYRYRFTLGSLDAFERRLDEAQSALGVPPEAHVPVTYVTETSWTSELLRLAPTVALVAAYIWFTRRQLGAGGLGGFGGGGGGGGGPFGGGGAGGRMNIFNVGKANVTTLDAAKQKKVTFADVAGCDEAKAEVTEFVDFLKNPGKYRHLGATIPRGALLVGPPGTGKTLLAKAVAGEAGVPFLSMAGSDFLEMFVGVGPARVRDLFAQARAKAPSIIFIDEIDAIGRQRGRGGFAGGNDERENTLNQLLVEMDGFGTTAGVVVLAGTNRADILDRALLRPGRFDRQITVDRPDVAGREQILNVHLARVKVDPVHVDTPQPGPGGAGGVGAAAGAPAVAPPATMGSLSARLAALTPGFTGADLANVVNEAALNAARRSASGVVLRDFEYAIDRVIGGLEKKHKVISPEERRVVAYHEAGHAVTGWFLQHAEPLLKVSIVPRGTAALGFAQYLPNENVLATEQQLLDMMCMTLGGRAAEELCIGSVTTGAQNDLEKVTRLAYSRVAVYGMSPKLGLLSFPPDDGQQRLDKPYSQETGALIDLEVREYVSAAYERTKALLQENRHHIEALAQALLAKEVLGLEDLTAILGQRPHRSLDASFKRNIDRYVDGTSAARMELPASGEGEGPGSGAAPTAAAAAAPS